jgi:hypothetical protein
MHSHNIRGKGLRITENDTSDHNILLQGIVMQGLGKSVSHRAPTATDQGPKIKHVLLMSQTTSKAHPYQ